MSLSQQLVGRTEENLRIACHGLSLNRAFPIRRSVAARWFGYISQQSVMCLFLLPAEASFDAYTLVVQ
jgi:hypothetical protein